MTIRTLLTTLALTLFCLTPCIAQAQERTKVEVILVMASNSNEGVDPQLKPYAETLQRLFRFSTYQQKDRKILSIEVPGGMTTNLFGGTSLQLGLQPIAGSKLPVNLDWRRGQQKLLTTLVRLNPGTPAVIGGPQAENTGTYLLIVRWQK
ncbi:hypothetical protein [Cerasicoccus arenae]|uniref:Uncharacterized protein n=1 Tax=Cerasicoccus arenae TaxID=424488 RepID=A0A8J3GD62_9BACT|nr:hypothetical protein [Cerasicoccus arenae]MBK1856676.1 hypothetical protein [Cerasicoccus arenae]GHB98847.1 hypothetical protein GCM10007047_13580 [Cerasicoccus arenae]